MHVSAEISANFQGFFKRVKRKKVRAGCILLQFFRKILSDLRGSRRLRLSKNQNLEHSGVVQISRKPHAPSTSTLTQGQLLVHDVDSKHENTTQCCSILTLTRLLQLGEMVEQASNILLLEQFQLWSATWEILTPLDDRPSHPGIIISLSREFSKFRMSDFAFFSTECFLLMRHETPAKNIIRWPCQC